MTALDYLRSPQAAEQLAQQLQHLDTRPERPFPHVAQRHKKSRLVTGPHFVATWWLTWARIELHTGTPGAPGLASLLDHALCVMVSPREKDDSYRVLDNGSLAGVMRLLSAQVPNLDSAIFTRFQRAATSHRIVIGPELTLWTRAPAAELPSAIVRIFTAAHEAVGP